MLGGEAEPEGMRFDQEYGDEDYYDEDDARRYDNHYMGGSKEKKGN